ncbi:hypothetical protein [Xanthomonas sp. 1678]|uniref:hypothetical protein n=1 Tax=Xanthomonas sp. 1678 TaxID=3158788 RepID=UPI0028609AB6|nr:hypothetical protein [Xanthomonas translucens]
MPIDYVPNDPRASKFNTARTQPAIANRPAKSAQLRIANLPKQSPYPVGTKEWLAWQVRESSYRALAVFEKIDGPLAKWPRSSDFKTLEVVLVLGNQANAYYDGHKLVFCQVRKAGKLHYTGASTDVVAHETGHAILDALRPDLWSSKYLEVAAFHESFADCIALLAALADTDIRRDLARPKVLDKLNYVETWGEQLAWLAGPGNSPRHALNKLTWHMPTANDEFHDFGQIFTGCFYDLIRLLFAAAKTKNEKTLWNATKKAAQLLFSAVRKAPDTPRYFQALGRVMDIESAGDASLQAATRAAFAAHGFMLGSAAILSPKSRLAGAIVSAPRNRWVPSDDAITDLRGRTGLKTSVPIELRALQLGGRELIEASYPRTINITGLGADYLEGVQAITPEGVLLGRLSMAPAIRALTPADKESVAIMSALPDSVATENEVMEFVGSLVRSNQIAPAPNRARHFSAISAIATDLSPEEDDEALAHVTHQVVETPDGGRVLERLRFACQCRAHKKLGA